MPWNYVFQKVSKEKIMETSNQNKDGLPKINSYIRPAALIWTMVIFTFLVFIDSATDKFNVNAGYLDILSLLFSVEIAFYFTSRGAEKIFKAKYDKDIKEQENKIRSTGNDPID